MPSPFGICEMDPPPDIKWIFRVEVLAMVNATHGDLPRKSGIRDAMLVRKHVRLTGKYNSVEMCPTKHTRGRIVYSSDTVS